MRRWIILVTFLFVLVFAGPSQANYDYSTGRWLQRDPIGYADGMNLYEYVKSNPINYIDYSGLLKKETCEAKVKNIEKGMVGQLRALIEAIKRLEKERNSQVGEPDPLTAACKLPTFLCKSCKEDARCNTRASDNSRTYGYVDLPNLVLCYENMDEHWFNHAIVHELVHVYDHCTWKRPGDFENCKQLACSEIRAYHLNRQCDNLGVGSKDWKKCIINAAVRSLSLAGCPNASKRAEAAYAECIDQTDPKIEPKPDPKPETPK